MSSLSDFDAPGPDALAPGAVVDARVLGPVEIVGWRRPPERSVVTELCCYLALHRSRPVSSEALLTALWPDGGRPGAAKTLRTYISLLRRSLGEDLFPEAEKGAGYVVDEAVSTDWERIQILVTDANALERDGDSEAAAVVLRRALQHVRGAPFTGVPAGSYSWAWTELIVAGMERTIASVGVRLARCALTTGDTVLAEWAARRALSAVPFDDALWSVLGEVASAEGPAARARVERDRHAVFGDGEVVRAPKLRTQVAGDANGDGPVIERARGLER